ncbi:MAG: LPS export ABC transporter periplasmic protein LptC [Ahniella sp.]|nr:LPS export ABC transporter periplasmic protein LptC [Ahniella sp.]
MSTRQTLIFLILMAGAVVTTWWVWLRPEAPPTDDFIGPPRSDYELGQFDMQVFDETGTLRYFVEAPRLARDSQRESFTIDSPRVRLFDQQEQHWLVTAKSGYIDVRGDRIDFNQNVVLKRDSKIDPIRFASEHLSAFPDAGRIETAAPIEIKARGGTLTGTGLTAELAAKTYRIEQDFHATLPTAHSD